jgi:hypothetical protein
MTTACARPPCSTRPFRPAPDVAPVRAQTRVPIAMTALELPSVRARTLCSRPVLPTRAHSPAFVPDAFAPAVADARRVRARSHASAPGVHARSHASAPGVRAHSHQSEPGPTRPRPLARVCAQCGHAFTSRCMRATSARL